MKRSCLFIAMLAVCSLAVCTPADAQMGMDIFKRPSISKVFHPVVGKGAIYQETGKDSKSRTMEIGVVGKETVEGREAFWMQFVADDDGKTMVGKSLLTLDDFKYHRMIVQMPGQQAMEMPMHPTSTNTRQKMEDSISDWHSMGTETITVPAGTFSCEHWHSDKDKSDAWTSDKISPFGMVKESGPNHSMVLTKVLDNVPDRITGPVKQFDVQQMMQEMQQRRQQAQPQ